MKQGSGYILSSVSSQRLALSQANNDLVGGEFICCVRGQHPQIDPTYRLITPLKGRKFINGSVEWLGVPAPFCNTGVDLTENIFVPSLRWWDVVIYSTWALGTLSVVIIGADVTWRSVVPACPDYLPIILPENLGATAHRVCDAHIWENPLERSQNDL